MDFNKGEVNHYFKDFDGKIKQLDKYHNGQIDEETYIVLRKKDKKLPPNPIEYFKKNGFTTIEKEFNINTQKNIKFANL